MSGLPIQLTTFIGRHSECVQVGRLLEGTRLLTLTGPGGVGKTRLALEVARAAADDYADGAELVELASIADPGLVAPTVAAELGLRDVPADELANALVAFLRAKHLMLVLDNCEHLLATTAELAEKLLRGCPRLTILGTSRQALAIGGETAWPVPSLSLPDVEASIATDEIAASEAAKLFVERARAVAPSFTMTDQNAKTTAQICRRLDGIPLAIELAAARVRLLSPEQILDRLDDGFGLLVTASRTAPSRQQTLRATLDWSYALLEEPERALLRSVSVFASGWTLEALESIAVADCAEAVLDRLGGLVDKSLVLADTGAPQTRYRLLETVRQYALEKVEQHQLALLRELHARYYGALAERADMELRRGDQALWLERLEREQDNLRAALGWARAANGELALQLCASLGRFWEVRGYVAEGRGWLEAVLAIVPGRTFTRASALVGLGELIRRSDPAGACTAFEEAIGIHAEYGDSVSATVALRQLGITRGYTGEMDLGRQLIDQSVEMATRLGDPEALGWALGTRGMLARTEADYKRAQACFDEAMQYLRPSGDTDGLAFMLNNMGQLARTHGAYAAAARLLDESAGLFRAIGSRQRLAWTLDGLANVLRLQGELARADVAVREALELDVSMAVPLLITAQTLAFTGILRITQGELSRGVELLTAAAHFPPCRASMDEDELRDWDRSLEAARAKLSTADFQEAFSRGAAMTLDQAVCRARAPVSVHAPEPNPIEPLTRRERDVLLLIADGKSNREISAQLVVSERTTEAHVSNILSKLGVRSRAQLVRLAVERGFVK